MKLTRLVVLPLVALALLAVACDNGDTVIQSGDANQQGITSAGVGRVVGTPDTVLLQLGVDVEQRTVEAAREQAARSMQAAIDSLKSNGVDEKDIRTVQFTVNPQYDFTNNRQTLRAYRVSNVVNARVRKIDSASKIIDDVTRAAGNDAVVRSLSFTIDDPSKLQAQARDMAVKQARERAEQLAKPAGVKLGRVLAITEASSGGNGNFLPQAAIAAPRTGDTSTPIQTGELEVVINVSVVFAIED